MNPGIKEIARKLYYRCDMMSTDAQNDSLFTRFYRSRFGVRLVGPYASGAGGANNAEMKQISNLFIARSFGTLIGSWMIGRFYDRIAGHPLLASSLLAAAAALALVPSAPQLPILFALFAFLGIALASINVGGNALLVMVHGERVTPFISALHCAFGLGGSLAPALVAQFGRRADGLHLTYWLLALAIVPVALLTFLSPSPSLREHQASVRRPGRRR